ncbi:MAG: transposase [bacterium]|nr:transposase [bacterium]
MPSVASATDSAQDNPLRLQDIIAAASNDFWFSRSVNQVKKRTLSQIGRCGSGHYGWTLIHCHACEHQVFRPRGCHDRSCPSCLSKAGKVWQVDQEERLLPTYYFHVVMTLPQTLRQLALVLPRPMYSLLMRAAKETLLALFRERDVGSCIPAILQVLHTWNQRLDHHPHVHMVVSGGGYDPHSRRWVPCPNPNFLTPGRPLAARFRDTFIEAIQVLRRTGKLDFKQHHSIQHLNEQDQWDLLLADLRAQNWNVFIKKPFGGPKQVIRYLARYTHRTAISNKRLLKLQDGRVTFAYQDRQANKSRTRTMGVDPFLTLFAIHIPPKSFRRVRAAGLLAPNCHQRRIDAYNAALEHHNGVPIEEDEPTLDSTTQHDTRCPQCGAHHFVAVAAFIPDALGNYTVHLLQGARKPPDAQAA